MVPLAILAQGSKGNTISFDETNCTQLRANPSTYFSFLRHNQAPIQILNGNPTASSTTGSEYYHTIAPLEEADGNGIFAKSGYTIANNMAFSQEGNNNGKLEFYNSYGNGYNALCFAIMAPRGYRFTEYYMDIRSTQAEYPKASNYGAAGAVITRYTYNSGSTWEYTLSPDESMTLSGTDSEIYTHTLSNAGNILYFRVTFTNATQQSCIHMNELRLRYVIDDEFEATIPNSSDENQVRTGILNLGEFTSASGQYVYTRTNVTDLEDVNIVADNGTTEMSVENGVISVPAGTYWIESPAKFRILGATLNLQMSDETVITYPSTTTLTSEKNYKIGDGNGNFITINNNGNATNTTDINSATVWTITQVSGGYTISTIRNSETYYLSAGTTGGTISISTNSFTWTYNSSDRTFRYQGNTREYGIRFNANAWNAQRTDRNTPTSITFYEETIEGVGYSATIYGTSATTSVRTANLSSSRPTASLSANNLNNDGVKFTVTGPAAFTVDLTLLPLDPNLQNLEFGYKKSDNSESSNMVSAAATNFVFNNGEPILLPLEPGETQTAIFRNAFNESRNNWYDGTETGYSNYYLVDSEYEKNGSENNAPGDKVNADRAGTTPIEFSNIKMLNTGEATVYQETVFDKNDAGYSTITLSTAEQPIDIYTADMPKYCIMTAAGKNVNNHVAYTFYDAILQGMEVNEEPVIDVTPLFTSSLKRNNVKAALYNNAMSASVSVPNDEGTDTSHKFYGIKVTARKANGGSGEVYGFLTSSQICEAIKTAMASQSGIYAGDVMRSILYVDMSELVSISGGAETWIEMMLGTGDNCLFFMPETFSISQSMPGGGIIAGGEGGTAVTDIVINDQQPFFTPYSFRTSTHVAHYERTQTHDKPTVTKSTLVLPFTVKLNASGNPKPTIDSENTKVTFYNLTDVSLYTDNRMDDGTYLDGVAAEITASPVTAGEATANTPYYITSTENTSETSFMIEIQGVTFVQTTLDDMTSENGNMTAHGSFNGVEQAKENGVLYWSKDYFWYSISEYLTASTVKFLPFRAYYTTDAQLTAKEGKFLLIFNELGETDGIEDTITHHPSPVTYHPECL